MQVICREVKITGLHLQIKTQPYHLMNKWCCKSKTNYIFRESNYKLFDSIQALKQPSNTITVTSGGYLSRLPVVNVHDVTSHGRNTHRWNNSIVHDIVRFIYKRMNVSILNLKG